METEIRFIADQMLGKLCQTLRMLGFDCSFFQGKTKHALFRIALREQRLILSRNWQLQADQQRYSIILLRASSIHDQLHELFKQLPLSLDPKLFFTRCLKCNGRLISITKSHIRDQVPLYVFFTQSTFFQCEQCQHIYWPATHLHHMHQQIKELTKGLPQQKPKT